MRTVTEWAVQTILDTGRLHTGHPLIRREQAEESASRLVALNGANCWVVSRERVMYPDEVTKWASA